MRIKSNSSSNIGTSIKGKRVLFPAQGILELPDELYGDFVEFINRHKSLEFLKKPVLSEEAQAIADEELEAKLRKQMAELQARKKVQVKEEGK